MSANYNIYQNKAIEACKQVFLSEYNRSIGIPLPIVTVDSYLPGDPKYFSGQYYISVGNTWQIHLDFGKLPTSYKEFQEEVRVLTRHEVEHYMCCPFDVLTDGRMINAIIDTYENHYSHHEINIESLSRWIANQASDIIIDTKNFYRHKSETLKSEIAWIKKTNSNSKNLPRHNRLMFLTKEAIWNESLELYEDDDQLKEKVEALAIKFVNEGIDNKNQFISKTIDYTHSFFELFEQDKQDEKQQNNFGTDSEQTNSQQIGQPQIAPSKDSQENGSQFIFQSPDKINEALIQLAQETSIIRFGQVIAGMGLQLSDREKSLLWMKAQNSDIIPIIEQSPKGSNDNYSYPTSWKLGDPLEEMDMMLSFSTSPVIIPGVTTKKWVQNPVFSAGSEKKDNDLLLIIDTSGSMGAVIDSKTNLHQAVLAAYGIIKYFESKKNQIALVGFSDRITVSVDWTKDYDYVREQLLLNGSGGTNFPINRIQAIIDSSKNPLVTVIITDGEIQNTSQTIDYFKEYLAEGNKLLIFLQDKKSTIEKYKTLTNYGAKVSKAITANEMRDSVVHDLM